MENTENSSIKTGYNDRYFRIVIAFIAANVIVVFGDRDSFFELLLLREFYIAVFASFIIALILVTVVNVVTVWLDKKYDWITNPLPRTGLQFVLAFLLPAVAAFLLAAIYFQLLGVHILDTVYLRYDFPVILILIVMLNIYYIAFYFYKQWKASAVTDVPDEKEIKAVFAIHGSDKRRLRYDEIAYFFHSGDFNFLRTRTHEDLLVSGTLDNIEQQLDNRLFFRVNRQMIVHLDACKSYRDIEHGKLEVLVEPAFTDAVIISQLKAKHFKNWMQLVL